MIVYNRDAVFEAGSVYYRELRDENDMTYYMIFFVPLYKALHNTVRLATIDRGYADEVLQEVFRRGKFDIQKALSWGIYERA